MSLYNVKPHHGNSSEYMVSSWPWVTSSNVALTATRYSFDSVTRWITIVNEETGASKNIIFGFTQNGTNGGNHFHVPPNTTFGPVEVKCSEIWVKSNQSGGVQFSLMAGLTNVTSSDFPAITGSNGFTNVG